MPYGLLLIGGAIGKRGRCHKVNSGGAGREGPLGDAACRFWGGDLLLYEICRCAAYEMYDWISSEIQRT